MELVIANKNYSSWSLRPWLLLSSFDIPFEEIKLSLAPEGLSERIGQYSPTKRVPVLIDNGLVICDSLAICEYVSEKYLDGMGWPEDMGDRALARSICAEMHSGFAALREQLPMNCRASRKVQFTAEVKEDISRINAIWSHCRGEYSSKGEWLFGGFSIADCFYAPVASRFNTYNVPLSDAAQEYADKLLSHSAFMSWVEAAKADAEVIASDEVGDS